MLGSLRVRGVISDKSLESASDAFEEVDNAETQHDDVFDKSLGSGQ